MVRDWDSRGLRLDGDPGKTRTSDLRFRKPSLYPPELQGHLGSSLPQSQALILCRRKSASTIASMSAWLL